MAGVTIKADFDSRDVNRVLAALDPSQWRKAQALALNTVARRVRDAEITEMHRVLDRPKPWTINSLFMRNATPSRPEANVWFKDDSHRAGHYLMEQVHGGERPKVGFEGRLRAAGRLPGRRFLVPASGAPKDAYGNVQHTLYNRILSQLGAQFDPTQNESAKSRAMHLRRRHSRYFYGNPAGRGHGVWERVAGGQPSMGSRMKSNIVPIFYERNAPRYQPRFHFFIVAERTIDGAYVPAFEQAVDQTLRAAR